MSRTSRPRRRIRVLIADDHRILLDALEAALTLEGHLVVGTANNGRRAVALARTERPKVAVLDSAMPVMNGVDAAREMLRRDPRLGVLLLTGQTEDHVVQAGLRVGVRGFVVKAQGLPDLVQAIHDVSEGAIYISPVYSRAVLDRFAKAGETAAGEDRGGPGLTPRELEMLSLIADGRTMKQAAGALVISTRTAESHRAALMRKLHIHDTAGLVRYAIRQGLIVA